MALPAAAAGSPEGAADAPLTTLQRLVRPARAALFFVGLAVMDLAAWILAIGLVLLPSAVLPGTRERQARRRWNQVIGFWARGTWLAMRTTMGLRLECDGVIPEGRLLVVSNHQSTVDIVVLFRIFAGKNLKFIVKDALLRGPSFVASALRQGGFGVVDFANPVGSLARLVPYCRDLESWDGSAVIFPEGIRSFDGSVGVFQPAGIQLLASRTGLPVVPVVLDGPWRARSLGRFFLYLPGSTIRVRVLPPIAPLPAGVSPELQVLPGRLEGMIRNGLARLRAGAAAPSTGAAAPAAGPAPVPPPNPERVP